MTTEAASALLDVLRLALLEFGTTSTNVNYQQNEYGSSNFRKSNVLFNGLALEHANVVTGRTDSCTRRSKGLVGKTLG